MLRSILAVLVLSVALSAVATSPWAARRAPATNCRMNSDCLEPLVCFRSRTANLCGEQCQGDSDCGSTDPIIPSGMCRNVTYLRSPDNSISPTTTSVIVGAPGQTSPGAVVESHNVCIQPNDPSWRYSRPPLPLARAGTAIDSPAPQVLPTTAQPPRSRVLATLLTTEQGYSRTGGQALDGRSDMPSPSAGLCHIACNGDAECRAYTYVSGGPGATPAGHCTLMATVAAAQDAPLTESGMKVTIDGGRVGQDLPGNDHGNFATLDPNDCAQTCLAQPRWGDGSGGGCRAWTWVKSGVQGKSGMCWLKSDSGAWQANPDTVSGLGSAQ